MINFLLNQEISFNWFLNSEVNTSKVVTVKRFQFILNVQHFRFFFLTEMLFSDFGNLLAHWPSHLILQCPNYGPNLVRVSLTMHWSLTHALASGQYLNFDASLEHCEQSTEVLAFSIAEL